MFDGTEVPTEYYETPTVPVKATATGTMGWWRYKAQETEGNDINDIKIIYEGDIICVIDVKTNDDLSYLYPTRPMRVYAPSKGYIDKIIKKKDEKVEEGETIAEWMPVPTVPLPLEILDRYGLSSIG
ncbi:MAG TPA: hypothetical protein ACFYED_00820 [Candidatus Tripitaka californicus]|uniref:hypothetical protein n=1 Tax=Candidatus Tripitaka californicus TaxID=3367616 RepID=UPI004029E8C2